VAVACSDELLTLPLLIVAAVPYDLGKI